MNEDLDPEMIELVFEEANNLHLHRPLHDLELERWLSDRLPGMRERLGNAYDEFLKTFFVILQRDFFRHI